MRASTICKLTEYIFSVNIVAIWPYRLSQIVLDICILVDASQHSAIFPTFSSNLPSFQGKE